MSAVVVDDFTTRQRTRATADNVGTTWEHPCAGAQTVVGAKFGLRSVMEKAAKVAVTDAPVVLTGETGVGKDVLANAIHCMSARRDGPFVTVNCGAIAESLVESELFGHEKGAFTGALSRKLGRFERANGGTIFLDEIGELPLHMQVKLLRVLQNREVERLGAMQATPIDVRVIAATNRDIEQMVRDGSFREDLWFRIGVFPIHVPSLRERAIDIPALVDHFVQAKTKELKLPAPPDITQAALDALCGHSWPGNVRELANVIERALIIHPAGPLEAHHLLMETGVFRIHVEEAPDAEASSWSIDDAIRRHIERCLEATDGRIEGTGGAAMLLDVNPSTLRNRMKRLGINRGAAVTRERALPA